MLAHLVRSLDQSDIVRSLAILLSLQGAIAVAMVSWSPRLAALTNEESRLFLLVATAACAAAVTLAPALLALLLPTSRTTRIALGLGQTLMAVMFFYLTGDHIRTRTGMVTALALLALNIDWVFIVSAEGSYAAELAANSEPEVKPLSAAASRTMELADKLEKALVNGGLSLVYQPIFRGNQQMVAVEALARWTDPEEGSIPPSEFIPAAEATGLIVPFSDWVLREACQQMAQWTTIDPTIERIAVNVSVKHIWCADFVQTVQRILIHTGLPAHRLELEVTESALVADFETVKRHLMHLRRLGVRISIDDFGTGYSSLSRVGELNADCLKVDRQFVQNASESARGAAVVQAIVDMAHSLNLSVIAEGVETHEQMAMLRTMGCDEVQGFLLARPQPATAITTTLLEVAVTREANRLHLVANHP